MSPKISEVAALAGVSTATVSRVLNHPQKVRSLLRERVTEAIEQLGYIRHGAASALASQRSNTIGAIIPTIDNAIFALSIRALQRHLSANNYTLLLASSEYDPRREYQEVSSLVERGIDGIMLVGERHHPGLEILLGAKNVPFVNTWSYHPDAPHSCIGFDNYAAMADLIRYLLDLGHRRFAMIAGITRHNDRAEARVTAVRETLAARGLAMTADCFSEQRYTVEAGRAATARLLALPRSPSAIVCGNDVLALGALFESKSRGVRVPEHCSITGFDDSELASHVSPPLTTIRVPSKEMGRAAAEYLLACLHGEAGLMRRSLSADLIKRASTAAPPA